ncbi:MAG: hypothetical protein EOM20_09105 [Spartobacteria bacterium]|nr:hypothetical protein [Spartobacteria bacterium]
MGTGRKFNKKPMTRPIKAAGPKVRRQRQQKERLVALGVDAETVAKMDAKAVRTMLQHPSKVTTAVAQ